MIRASTHKLTAGCIVLAVFFLIAGAMHFIKPDVYARIVPPLLPAPFAIIYISGIAEIAGGLGLLLSPTRRLAAWGLVALLICVFPANIYCAVAHVPFPGVMGKSWVQWARLPLQLPLILWAWLYTR